MTALDEYAECVARAASGHDWQALCRLRQFLRDNIETMPDETLLQVSRTILHCRRGEIRGQE